MKTNKIEEFLKSEEGLEFAKTFINALERRSIIAVDRTINKSSFYYIGEKSSEMYSINYNISLSTNYRRTTFSLNGSAAILTTGGNYDKSGAVLNSVLCNIKKYTDIDCKGINNVEGRFNNI